MAPSSMAPSSMSVTSSMRAHETMSFISPSKRNFPGIWESIASGDWSQYHQHQTEQRQPETPVGQQRHQTHMRDTAERYNRNNRIVRQQRSPVPAADLATSNLEVAFPAFSGVQKAVRVAFSPDPHNLDSPISHSKSAQLAQSKCKAAESKGKATEPKGKATEPKGKATESKGKATEPKGKSDDWKRQREFSPLLGSASGSDDGSVVSDDAPDFVSDDGCSICDRELTDQQMIDQLDAMSPVSSIHPSPCNVNWNTRFGRINNAKTRQGPQPDMYKSAPGLLQAKAVAAPASVSKPMAINDHGSLTSMPNGSTQSTLNLPQGPNLTAVFDGARRRPGYPGSRLGRPGDPRSDFASKAAEAAKSRADGLPVPALERQLLCTIDTLLAQNDEMGKELETTQITLEQKVHDHEVELKRLRERRDSGVASAGTGDEKRKGSSASSQRLESENKRLVATYWDLTRQRDSLQSDVQTAQTTIQTLEQQRDYYKECSATAESDIARIRSETTAAVQTTIRDLERQRDNLKEQLATADSNAADIRSKTDICNKLNKRTRDKLAVAESNIEALTRDRDELLDENDELRAQIAHLRRAPSAKADATPDGSRLEHADADADADDEGPLDMDSGALMIEQPNAQQNKQFAEQQTSAHGKAPSCESSQNFTYISNARVPKSDPIRNNLEHQRTVRRQSQEAGASKAPVIETLSEGKTIPDVSNMHTRHSSDSTISTTIIKRHSSQKMTHFPNVAERQVAREAAAAVRQTADAARQAAVAARRTAAAARQTAAAAASLPPLDMAPLDAPVILATASLPPLEMAPFDRAAVSPAANLPPLEMAPLAVVQHQTQQSDIGREQPQQAHEPAKLPNVPDEELDITVYNFEPTERPTQSPAAALTAVLESVQAERASQQVQLAKYQSNYNRLDINQRQRKQLFAKIIALTESIDRKADQIHNLHDLVVCQERKGQSMTQNQVDNTLQSLGLAAPWEGIASSTATSRRRSTASSRSN
ncbi:MAG: hypothetical protein Q9224_003752 [Gallowayella concinna]